MDFRLPSTWGVRLLAIWAFVLAVIPFANILLLTAAVEFYSNRYNNQTQIWIIFFLQACFGVGFAISGYGLWRYQNWGRVLFLWASTIWFGVNIIALFVPSFIFFSIRQYSTSELIWNGIRFFIALTIPVWYLTQPHVRFIFDHDPVENIMSKEVTSNDNGI